ncbi:transcriptional regulator, TetR family [Solimonas aquatica]|uniref:Transcriptional regulator, TetR family n=1 Tax=Solimonas aquatica TaxID=489703 RepID=A0A1H9BLU3_9GAMM|nr:TetR/AcrR family transcriptional regulator [Solimonas aquatica]SEP89940.1 transcriptional regulator, TetR family [Solimonas aquatica]
MSQKTTRARGAATEQAILQATLELLHEGGYSALTIDRVAARARASKTTIYRRWKTKEHLVLAVLQLLPMPMPERSSGSLQTDLIELFRQFARIMADSPLRGVLPMLVAECANNPALSHLLVPVNERRRAPLRKLVELAIERGELATHTDVELLLDVIQGAIAIRMYFLLDKLDERWIRGLVQLLMEGLRGPPQTRVKARKRTG